MTLEIRQHAPGKDTGDFIAAAFEVFRDDPAWVPPLNFDIAGRLNPKENPLFHHADVALFTARRDGRLVGRLSATVDRGWLDVWKDATGHFGFFDTIDDKEVAQA